jgi:DNA-directed RNA polymerase subunit beta
MPYLQDGGSIDKVFNLLGLPSWMNVGRIFQYLLGLAESLLYIHYRVTPFDERYE